MHTHRSMSVAPAIRGVLLLTGLALSVSACGEGTGPNSAGRVGIGFQLARSASASAFAASSDGTPSGTSIVGAPPVMTTTNAGLLITRDADALLVTRAQLVIRDVKLKTAAAICHDDDNVAADNSSGSSRDADHDDDDCPTFRVGPFLVDMPVSGADGGRVAVSVPEGTYSSVRLTLHKVTSSDPADAAFRQANPDFRDISVRLEGTFNGTPFVFVGDVDAKITVPLTAPIAIKAGGEDVTVAIDLSSWFLRAQGGLYAPSLANTPGAVRALVQNNIRSTFRAFRDHNRDGRED